MLTMSSFLQRNEGTVDADYSSASIPSEPLVEWTFPQQTNSHEDDPVKKPAVASKPVGHRRTRSESLGHVNVGKKKRITRSYSCNRTLPSPSRRRRPKPVISNITSLKDALRSTNNNKQKKTYKGSNAFELLEASQKSQCHLISMEQVVHQHELQERSSSTTTSKQEHPKPATITMDEHEHYCALIPDFSSEADDTDYDIFATDEQDEEKDYPQQESFTKASANIKEKSNSDTYQYTNTSYDNSYYEHADSTPHTERAIDYGYDGYRENDQQDEDSIIDYGYEDTPQEDFPVDYGYGDSPDTDVDYYGYGETPDNHVTDYEYGYDPPQHSDGQEDHGDYAADNHINKSDDDNQHIDFGYEEQLLAKYIQNQYDMNTGHQVGGDANEAIKKEDGATSLVHPSTTTSSNPEEQSSSPASGGRMPRRRQSIMLRSCNAQEEELANYADGGDQISLLLQEPTPFVDLMAREVPNSGGSTSSKAPPKPCLKHSHAETEKQHPSSSPDARHTRFAINPSNNRVWVVAHTFLKVEPSQQTELWWNHDELDRCRKEDDLDDEEFWDYSDAIQEAFESVRYQSIHPNHIPESNDEEEPEKARFPFSVFQNCHSCRGLEQRSQGRLIDSFVQKHKQQVLETQQLFGELMGLSDDARADILACQSFKYSWPCRKFAAALGRHDSRILSLLDTFHRPSLCASLYEEETETDNASLALSVQ